MNSLEEVRYRLNLSRGFLMEAEQDFSLKRWRSCVDNCQLAVENAGKTVLALYGTPGKTHNPAKSLSKLLNNGNMDNKVAELVRELIPDLITLGLEEHFMTDYGDESRHILPWDLFSEESGTEAIETARNCVTLAKMIVDEILPDSA